MHSVVPLSVVVFREENVSDEPMKIVVESPVPPPPKSSRMSIEDEENDLMDCGKENKGITKKLPVESEKPPIKHKHDSKGISCLV